MADVFLCGIKHCGKTTFGRLLARRYGCAWRDADRLTASLLPEGATIRSFYREHGKDAFHELEAKALAAYEDAPHARTVVSMGGGACDNPGVMATADARGTTVYLAVPEPVLLERILQDGIPPFLDPRDPARSFHELYVRRDALYRQLCSLTVSLDGIHKVPETGRYLSRRLKEVFDGPQHVRQ